MWSVAACEVAIARVSRSPSATAAAPRRDMSSFPRVVPTLIRGAAERNARVSTGQMCDGGAMASVEQRTAVAGGLFNPATYDGGDLDPEARRIMLATIEFF